ncbi:hypothetical protein OROGR_029963 [Orobanche gracilis]
MCKTSQSSPRSTRKWSSFISFFSFLLFHTMHVNRFAHTTNTTRSKAIKAADMKKNLSLCPSFKFGGIHPGFPSSEVIFITDVKITLHIKLPKAGEDIDIPSPILFNPSGICGAKNSHCVTWIKASETPTNTYCEICHKILKRTRVSYAGVLEPTLVD